jgi:hypothetical protein
MSRTPASPWLAALLGVLSGALAARAAFAIVARRRSREEMSRLVHDLRGPLTVVRGEAELVIAAPEASVEARQRSAATIVAAVEEALEALGSVGDRAARDR